MFLTRGARRFVIRAAWQSRAGAAVDLSNGLLTENSFRFSIMAMPAFGRAEPMPCREPSAEDHVRRNARHGRGDCWSIAPTTIAAIGRRLAVTMARLFETV